MIFDKASGGGRLDGNKKSAVLKQRIQLVEKVHFYKNGANSLSLTPNPFPVVKGCVCLVGFASLQSPWAYTPGIRAGAILLGLPPLDPVGGGSPCDPNFLIIKKFFDSLNPRFKTADLGIEL